MALDKGYADLKSKMVKEYGWINHQMMNGIPKKEDLNAPIKNILNLTGQLQPLDQLYTIKECLKALLEKEKKAHIMDESFCTGQVDDLNEAYDLMTAIYDYDPTPQHLYDDSGGEPPVTMNEMVNQAYKEKYGV